LVSWVFFVLQDRELQERKELGSPGGATVGFFYGRGIMMQRRNIQGLDANGRHRKLTHGTYRFWLEGRNAAAQAVKETAEVLPCDGLLRKGEAHV